MHLRFSAVVVGFLSWVAVASANDTLLENAVENWLGERDHWSFTQRAVEFENGTRQERVERYDPSLPGNQRWTLLTVDGKPPTGAEQEAWAKKKFGRKPRRVDTPLGDFFDFKGAKRLAETSSTVQYEVPLRNDRKWLFQADKLNVVVTINKQTKALERLVANVREPVKVLLGLARIHEGGMDLSFLNPERLAEPGPEAAQPQGTAHVSVSRLGERIEFTWSDFKRVDPRAVADARKSR